MLRERLRALRERRIAIGHRAGPADRRSRIDRRFEIVAKRCAERRLVALVDGEQVDGGRPKLLCFHVDQLGQRLRLGFEPVHAAVRFALRPSRHIERLSRAGMRRFGAQRRGFSLRHRVLRGLGRCRECDDIRRAILRLVEVGKLVLDLADLRLEAHQPHRVLAHRAFELVAPRDEIGERAGQFAEGLFDRGKRRFGSAHARRYLGFTLGEARAILRKAGFFAGKPLQRGFGIGLLALLARDILDELREPAIKLQDALVDARFLAIELLARDHKALQRRTGFGFFVAQRRQVGGRVRLTDCGFGLRARRLGDTADARILGALGFGDLGMRRDPAQVEQRRLGLAHVGRHLLVLDRLARLTLQRIDLLRQLPDHVFKPVEVCFRRLQPQLRLMTARMQAGDTGGFFQHAAALLGLRLDDFADAALMHEGRRTRARRGVREQKLHVACAHLAAVETIERALLAFDAAPDFERLVFVELRGRGAVRVVEKQHHLGGVARRAGVGAGEDHVFHAGGAQRLVGGFAHHPAQRFDQIGLAAAVRADHAGQPVLDVKIRRLDERLEPEQTQLVEFHYVSAHPVGAQPPLTAPVPQCGESGAS